jgi:exodeoxyribonuclease V beta subunit
MERFVAYEASAGSGKTFALTLRYISLLFLENQPNRILALTFTNKASNEMKTRIQNTLKNLGNNECKAELCELSKILKTEEKELLKSREKIYQNFLKQDNYIMTIDKFCSMILRKFAFYIGLMPDFTIEQKESLNLIILHFIKSLQKEKLYEEFIKFSVFEDKKLNAVFDILYFFYEKFFVLPKCKSETEFDEQTIFETFDLLKKRILECDKLSPSGKKAVSVNSIEEIYKAGWFCKESLEEYSYFKKCYQPDWDDEFEKLKSKLKRYFLFREARYINNLLKFFQLFKEINFEVKRELNDLSFLDISNFTYEILHNGIDRDFFYFRLDAKFDHILLDEFQDTSLLQFEILKPLFDEIVSGVGTSGGRSIFYVGDIKQSIYRFRGGNKELFYDVAKRYDMDIKRLNANYRSKKEIVEFVNKTFKGKMENYFEQIPNDKKGGGYVSVLKSENLTENVVEIITKLLDNGIKEDDIAILTYTNDDAFTLEEEIKKQIKDIKVATQTTTMLLSNHEVKIIVECMKYIYFEEKFYLYNFLMLLGKDLDDEMDLDIFSKEMTPLDFACECIKNFELNTVAVLDFLNELRNYDDLESLLFKLDEFNVQVPQKDIEGLKILTIHKSKGLEFKHLIVCDRLKRKNSDRKSWVLSYKDLKPKNLFLKAKNRECVDKEYKSALEKERRLQLQDELNAIYVAFTRAKESLFIIEKEKSSAFSTLNLKEESFGEFPKSSEEKTITLKTVFDYKEPSVGKQKDVMTFEEESDKESDFEAINFGLATHYMLEMLDGFDKNSLDYAYQAMKNRYQDLIDTQKTEDIKKRVETLLKNSLFMKMIKSSVLYKELPLVYEGELKQIDLFVESKEEIKIIDYKTSKFVQSEHVKQVREYMNIAKAIKQKKVSGYLCYLQNDGIKLVEVKTDE